MPFNNMKTLLNQQVHFFLCCQSYFNRCPKIQKFDRFNRFERSRLWVVIGRLGCIGCRRNNIMIDGSEKRNRYLRSSCVVNTCTSASNCLEEFDGSNLKPAVALSARGVIFH